MQDAAEMMFVSRRKPAPVRAISRRPSRVTLGLAGPDRELPDERINKLLDRIEQLEMTLADLVIRTDLEDIPAVADAAKAFNELSARVSQLTSAGPVKAMMDEMGGVMARLDATTGARAQELAELGARLERLEGQMRG